MKYRLSPTGTRIASQDRRGLRVATVKLERGEVAWWAIHEGRADLIELADPILAALVRKEW